MGFQILTSSSGLSNVTVFSQHICNSAAGNLFTIYRCNGLPFTKSQTGVHRRASVFLLRR